MSEALADELEAINSIYGEGTLFKASQDDAIADDSSDGAIYILSLPGGEAEGDIASARPSIRLRFSSAYPDEPPTVLGTHSSGEHGRRGAAARDLVLFRDAVGEVYEPGQVCLFDAIEKVKELLDAAKEDEPVPESGVGSNAFDGEQHDYDAAVPTPDLPLSPPPWVLSGPVVELKSTFIARSAPVTSPTQAAQYVQHLLSSDRKIRSATHNMTAWRIRGPNGTSFQDCDDDGETAAGGRLLHLMQLMDLWDTMVVVTRWYGGQKLGPRRFALINQAARDSFVKAGLVAETAVAKKKGHGK
ncbi:ribosomal protein S5 domain 2-type protein [Lasiosphaeria hispida]|uniref:Ribosomal protein S5 domain 2-type protein n=1 Tax=Lasiosphaeria hispida TaxID=260671 RepID=A0AAJ0HQE0_9PEZI|nr:ribosomal protein S5 domain 2-type protein [Lasiosphaeria hispida]